MPLNFCTQESHFRNNFECNTENYEDYSFRYFSDLLGKFSALKKYLFHRTGTIALDEPFLFREARV